MAVPAHDERDFEFATKYNLAIKQVIQTQENLPYTQKSGKLIHSQEFDNLDCNEARLKIISQFEAKNIGKRVVKFLKFVIGVFHAKDIGVRLFL